MTGDMSKSEQRSEPLWFRVLQRISEQIGLDPNKVASLLPTVLRQKFNNKKNNNGTDEVSNTITEASITKAQRSREGANDKDFEIWLGKIISQVEKLSEKEQDEIKKLGRILSENGTTYHPNEAYLRSKQQKQQQRRRNKRDNYSDADSNQSQAQQTKPSPLQNKEV